MARRPGAGSAKKIENSVLRGGLRKHLFVHLLGQERDIDSGDILLNDGLQPAFGLRAVMRPPFSRISMVAPTRNS